MEEQIALELQAASQQLFIDLPELAELLSDDSLSTPYATWGDFGYLLYTEILDNGSNRRTNKLRRWFKAINHILAENDTLHVHNMIQIQVMEHLIASKDIALAALYYLDPKGKELLEESWLAFKSQPLLS